ncbi:MAG: ATP-binding protein [Pseudomonadota bacterium]
MDVSWELQLDARAPDSPWAVLSRRLGGDGRLLGAFALLHAALVAFALLPSGPVGDVVIVWPAAGLLLLVLWLSPRRLWLLIFALQVGLELLLGGLVRGLSAGLLVATLAHAVAGFSGALVIRRMFSGVQGLRVVSLLRFAYAAAASAAVGALVQVSAVALTGAGADLPRQALMLWLASLLGALTTVPLSLAWLLSRQFAPSFPALSRAQRFELAAVLALQLVVVVRLFRGVDFGPEHLRFPVMIMPGLIYAAFRLPPRWATALMGGTGLLAACLVAGGGNPLAIEDPVARVLWLQFGMLVFLLATVTLSAYIAQSRIALAELAANQARYRSFIQLSSEAVWRVELQEPMPVSLSLPEQIEWLRRHAQVAESSASFGRVVGAADTLRGAWAAELPWVQMFEANLEKIRQRDYSADDLRFSAIVSGQVRTYLTALNGVVHGGRLERIWGVARDVTELLDLNARLKREQELLRSYAQRLVGAEEGARRATAAELHDGIGQELVAMSMMLSSLASRLTPEQRAPLDEFRGRLHRVQQRTRDMISDLSPPGLYDLGLMPALQWLVVNLRGRDQLRVELDGVVDEASVPTQLRVLVFRLVREMLRNVVKHAKVDAATVRIRGDRSRLVIEVRDEGRGFDWHPDHLTNPGRGLGLWSIASRAGEVGGQLSVDSAPGRGACFTLTIPLGVA